MSRARDCRLRVTGQLVARSPLHVGGLGTGDEVDLALARDGRGNVYVPGTSLAGALRAWMTASIDDRQLVEAMWGFQDPRGNTGHASFIVVDDALVEQARPEVWDHVRIDRRTGAAAAAFKFDHAVLPRGSSIHLDVSIDLPVQSPAGGVQDGRRVRAALGCLLSAMENGDVPIGAAQTRGLGQIRLTGLRIVEEDWTNAAGLVRLLRSAASELRLPDLLGADAGLPATERVLPRRALAIDFVVDWEPDGPLMVRAGQSGLDVDGVPFTSAVDPDRLAFTIPGSSLKGAFRSQAERIVRTVCGRRSGRLDDRPHEQRADAQIGEPLVGAVFGMARPNDTSPPNGRVKGAKGVLSFDTCFALNAQPDPSRWTAVLNAPRGQAREGSDDDGKVIAPGHGASPLLKALTAAGLDGSGAATVEQAFRVAIDRWTGGSAEHLLFSTLEPQGVEWEPLRLRVDLARLDLDDREPAIALLLLLLRDFAANRIPIGFGANRGFGAVRLRHVTCHVRSGVDDDGLSPHIVALHDVTFDDTLTALPTQVRDGLGAAWHDWIARHREQEVQTEV